MHRSSPKYMITYIFYEIKIFYYPSPLFVGPSMPPLHPDSKTYTHFVVHKNKIKTP